MKRLFKLFQSDFNKNVLTLFTGTAVAQILPVAITPILTRIYGPKEFGILALYTAIISILLVLSSVRYELAIILPENEDDAINIVGLSAFLTVFISAALFIILLIGGERLSAILGLKELGIWIYFLPLSLVILGVYQILYYWFNRRKMYKEMSVNKVIQQAGVGTANITFGFASNGTGLILGTMIGQFLALFLIVKKVLKSELVFIKNISKKGMMKQARRYVNFPKYFAFAHTLNVSSSNLASILFTSFFSAVTVGYFTLTQRVLRIPLSLVGSAIADVFRQKAAEEIRLKGNCKYLYLKTLKSLFILSIVPFGVLYFISPWLFSLIFGSEWRIAGEYARLMMPMLFFQFLTNPLSNLSIILEKNSYEIIWQIGLFLTTTGSLVIGYKVFHSIKISIILFTIAYSVMYIIDGIMMYKFAVEGNLKSEKLLQKSV